MHRLLCAVRLAISDYWHPLVQYVQGMWLFGPWVWVCVCVVFRLWRVVTDLMGGGGYRDLGRDAKEMCVHTHTHIQAPRPLISGDICSGPGHWQRVLGWAQKYHHGNCIA